MDINTIMINHYKALADKYDNLYSAVNEYRDEVSANITKILDLQPDDILADIGGGIGKWAETIKRLSPLKHDVIVVDPIPEMTRIAATRSGVQTITTDAMSFITSNVQFTKCFFAFSVQHIVDFRDMFAKLRKRGAKRVLMVLDSKDGSPWSWLPTVFDWQKDTVSSLCRMNDALRTDGQAAGWEIISELEKYYYVNKDSRHVSQMVRNRAFSGLAVQSQADIDKLADYILANEANDNPRRKCGVTLMCFG